MALPTTPESREEILARRRAAEEETLLREVDEAVRQDDLLTFGRTHGRQLAIGIGAALVLFGGYLFWQSRQDAGRETDSEQLVVAMDQAQAGNLREAVAKAEPLIAEKEGGPAAVAQLLAASAVTAQNNPADATKRLTALANNPDAPEAFRELAKIRLVALEFDTMDKNQAVARLTPLARPDSSWFGTAGELLAMAYLELGKRAEAGKLLADISRNTDVPEGIRSRTRQMAGVLGVDAVGDVDKFMAQQRRAQQNAANAPQPGA